MTVCIGVLAVPSSFIRRFFQDVLKLNGPSVPEYMLSSKGCKAARWRHDLVVLYLRHGVGVFLAIFGLEF